MWGPFHTPSSSPVCIVFIYLISTVTFLIIKFFFLIRNLKELMPFHVANWFVLNDFNLAYLQINLMSKTMSLSLSEKQRASKPEMPKCKSDVAFCENRLLQIWDFWRSFYICFSRGREIDICVQIIIVCMQRVLIC